MAPTKEELGKLKLPDLQREPEVRGLEVAGKKQELAEWLVGFGVWDWSADEKVSPQGAVSTQSVAVSDVSLLLAKMKIIKERQILE